MKYWLLWVAITTILLSPFDAPLRAADADEEQQLVAILQSNATAQRKDTACVRLKRIGTAASVAAVAGLLADEQLSQSARYVLESMPFPEAGRALAEALDKTTGLTRVGIINSLGMRREETAIAALAKLLADADTTTQTAAAAALGKIAGPQGLKALQEALPGASGSTRAALVGAMLMCANQMLAGGDRVGASAVFRRVYQGPETEQARTGAYEGLIRAAGDGALSLVIAGLSGNDVPSQMASLQVARDIKDPAATKALANMLPQAAPAMQIALIEVLNQRGDPSAAPAVLALATSQNADVRIAAFNTLGNLGGALAVPALATAAVSTDKAEQKAARQALLQIRDITEALMTHMALAPPPVQAEIVRALGGRAEKGSVAKLLEMARNSTETTRFAALRALTLLADNQHLTALVQLQLDATGEPMRTSVQDALIAICQRLHGTPGFDAGPIVEGLSRGQVENRAALLRVCGVLTGPRVRAALRAGVNDADPRLKSAAIRALCEANDPDLLADVLAVARATTEPNIRSLAMRSYVRLATDEDNTKLNGSQRAGLLKQALELANNAEEKRLILSGLGSVRDAEALRLVLSLLDDRNTQAEAAHAATMIAGAISGTNPELARSTLKNVIAVSADTSRRQAAEAVLKQMDAASDFITAWQVAGPYAQEGKNYAALFDIVFAPEKAGGTDVVWKNIPSGTNPKQPGLLDLLKFMGGEHRVAYARTRIYSEIEQPARLELGSDDGVKAWLNDKLVHANNAARPLTVGSDKVDITLKKGWNMLLLKITQNVTGWEFCARVAKSDGSRIEGLRFDPSSNGAAGTKASAR